MSLYEFCEISGFASLLSLFDNYVKIIGINKYTLEDIAYLCCGGGWTRSKDMDKAIALWLLCVVINFDISKVDNVTKKLERGKHLTGSYARNIGSQASNETLML